MDDARDILARIMNNVERDIVKAEILAELRKGRTLTDVCREPWAPAAPTVIDWLACAHFAEEYARARQIGYTLMGDEYVDTVRTARVGVKRKIKREAVSSAEGGVQLDAEGAPLLHVTERSEETFDAVDRARLHADGLRWFLSKALPKIYGDKLQVEPPSVPGGGFTLTWK